MKTIHTLVSVAFAAALGAGCSERNAITSPPAQATLAPGPTFTTIDFPGGFVTLATDINKTGQIVGRYTDVAGIVHGFLLSNGAFSSVTFTSAVWTRVAAINRGGSMVGDYSLTSPGKDAHGFLLQGGNYISFDFPGAGSTRAQGIDANGDIVGFYTDNATDNTNNRHGFLLSGGAFAAIDFPGAGSSEVWRINDNGEILGRYLSTTSGKWHLYRLSNGSFTAIADFPGAAQTAPDGYGHLGGFNSQGDITSDYCSSTPCQNLFNQTAAVGVHGFLLSAGVYTSIDPPAAMASLALGINDGGDIVGTFADMSQHFHGYLRTP